MITLLDGPMGTQLLARGVPTPAPLWSAHGLIDALDVVGDVHAAYRAAGATVHTTNTFRTQRRWAGEGWAQLTLRAVEVCRRRAGGPGMTVAGSIAPIQDCYRPDLSPDDPRPEHRWMAQALAAAGCDMLLVETFPHVAEGLVAVEEAVAPLLKRRVDPASLRRREFSSALASSSV